MSASRLRSQILDGREHVRGGTGPVTANFVVEALRYSLPDRPEPGSGPAVVTVHCVENLTSTRRTDELVTLACRLAAAGRRLQSGESPSAWPRGRSPRRLCADNNHVSTVRRIPGTTTDSDVTRASRVSMSTNPACSSAKENI